MHYEPYAQRTLAKLRSANELYAKWMLRKVAHIDGAEALQTQEHLRTPPEDGWEPINARGPGRRPRRFLTETRHPLERFRRR